MLFKILHGDSSNISLDVTPFHEGWCYVTHDGYFYVDLNVGTKEEPNNQRIKLNAAEADTLTGYSISTILNSSDSEMPTSKAVLDALEDVKTEALNNDVVVLAEAQKAALSNDVVVLAEAQKSIDAVSALVGDVSVSDQISKALGEVTADDFGIYVQAQEPIGATAGDIWIDTANDPSYIPPALPEITNADNGKILMVVNGKLQLVNLNLSIDANGVVSM